MLEALEQWSEGGREGERGRGEGGRGTRKEGRVAGRKRVRSEGERKLGCIQYT